MDNTVDCLDCSHCTYIHEYECFICSEGLRMAFDEITSDLGECKKFNFKERD